MLSDGLDIFELYKDVEIIDSAYKHGVSKEDILHAIHYDLYTETIEMEPNKTLIIGIDKQNRLLEIICHITSDDSVIVFHSMECRNYYKERLFSNEK